VANPTTFEFTATMSVFQKRTKIYFFKFKTHKATRGVAYFYNAGVVTRSRRIGTLGRIKKKYLKTFNLNLNYFFKKSNQLIENK
jgi:hypothetical protein